MNKNKWFLNGGRGSGRTIRLLCETYENKIAELEESNKEWQRTCEAKSDTNSQLTEQLADKVEEIAELERKLEQTEKDLSDYQFNYPSIKELQKENAELKYQLNKNPCVCNTEWHCNDCLEQLTKAKEILKDITSSYGSTEVSEAQLYLKIKKAEQFLNSKVEK